MGLFDIIINKKRVFISTFATMTLVLLFIFIDIHLSEEKGKIQYSVINDNCKIYVNEKNVYCGKSNYYDLSYCKRGDIVEFECILNNGEYINPILFFSNDNNVIEVFFNNQMIYSFGKFSPKAKIYGNNIIRVPIDNDYFDGKLRIKLTVGDDNSIEHFPEIRFMRAIDADKIFIIENIFAFFVSILFLFLGIICILFVFYVFGFKKVYRKISILALLTTVSALWILSKYNIIEFWSSGYSADYYLEYNSLFLLIISLIYYTYIIIINSKMKKVVHIVMITETIFVVIINLLQMFQVLYLEKTSHIFEIISGAILFGLFISVIVDSKKAGKNINMYLLGISVMIFFVVIYLVTFYLNKTSTSFYGGCIPLILFVFFVMNYMSFINEITTTYISKIEAKSLVTMAYKDPLTKLPNRRAYNDFVREINSDNNTKYAVFSFDLNNLKKVNDEYGHLAGDELICRFAKALSILSLSIFSARIGGDEFVSFIKNPEDDTIKRYIKDISVAVDMLNDESDKPYVVDYAYGYAIYDHNNFDIEKVMFKADENMYRYKTNRKSEFN